MSEIIYFTENEREYLRELAKKCNISVNEHRKKAKFYKKISYCFTIPLIISNITTLLLNAWKDDNNDNNNEIKITTMVVLGINALSTSCKDYLKFDKRKQYHLEKEVSYKKLAVKIESSLAARVPKFNFDELTNEKISIVKKNIDVQSDIEINMKSYNISYNKTENSIVDKNTNDDKCLLDTSHNKNINNIFSNNLISKHIVKSFSKDFEDIDDKK